MERVSELILRNAGALPAGPVLLINPPRDSLFRELAARGPVRAFTQDCGDYRWLADCGAEARFGLLPWTQDETAQSVNPATVILMLPREKERLDLLLHAVASHLPPAGELWLAGENRAGIKSAGARLERRFGTVAKIDSARHCGLFRAAAARPHAPFRIEDHQRQWDLQLPAGLPGAALRIVSLPGVFAHGRLDRGSALMLEYLAAGDSRLGIDGKVLDFGCGAGVLGLALLRVYARSSGVYARSSGAIPGMHLTLLDSSAIALASAGWTLEANGIAPASVDLLAEDGLPATGPGLDWIVSNPPFHRGVGTDLDIARAFFRNSAVRLAKWGKLLLVCNRHLPYERWLEAHFTTVENRLSDRDFKVLLAAGSRA